MEQHRQQLDDLRAAAAAAMSARRRLSEVWKRVDRDDVASLLQPEDTALLMELVLSRVEVLNAFEMLVRFDASTAAEVLERRYLGAAVDPDRKFGGYVFELATMLDDWVEHQGIESLRSFLSSESLPADRLRDPRVQQCIREACDLDDDQDIETWLQNPIGA